MNKTWIPILCACSCIIAHADPRIRIPATINGQDVDLAFDTGAGELILWEQTLSRLGITWTNPPPAAAGLPGNIPLGRTEEFELTINRKRLPTRARVYRPPSALVLDVDGLLGWQCATNNVLRIDPHLLKVDGLTELPDDIDEWNSWMIKTNTSVLAFDVPDFGAVFIDTGMPGGVSLRQDEWMKLKNKGIFGRSTLMATFMPHSGLKVVEECWADHLDFGAFSVSGLPVTVSHSGEALNHPDYRATLGLFALTRIEMIIDGKRGVLYTRAVPHPSEAYPHNRMAAVFVPENLQSDELLAHVVPGGPAHCAGLRKGDCLMKIDGADFTHWRAMPNRKPFGDYWEQPDGTTIDLVVQRNGVPVTVKVVLEDIFPLPVSQ